MQVPCFVFSFHTAAENRTVYFGFLEKNSGCLREAFRETIEKEANQFIYNKITWI